jgi:geranylgeranyl pyrophosphate synthase
MGRLATSVKTGRFPLVEHARQLIRQRLEEALRPIEYPLDIAGLLPGKMLRTHLADCLLRFSTAAVDPRWITQGCAATEMIHTASLCHDDVIDGGAIRRGRPALWRQAGAPAAVGRVHDPPAARRAVLGQLIRWKLISKLTQDT